MDVNGLNTSSPGSTGYSISEEEAQQIREELNQEFRQVVLPTMIFIGTEIVLGFFGNLFVLCVFFFRYHKCNYRSFVLCLAVIDITTTVTTMPGDMMTQMFWYVYPVPEICATKSFFNVFTVVAETLCLLTIALDRYRKVCRPFNWQITRKAATYLCFSFYPIGVAIALPIPFLWGERTLEIKHGNVTLNVKICEKSENFKTTDYPIGYILSVFVVMFALLILMFVYYVFIAKSLLKQRRLRTGLTKCIKPDVSSGNHNVTEDTNSSQDKVTDTFIEAGRADNEGNNTSYQTDTEQKFIPISLISDVLTSCSEEINTQDNCETGNFSDITTDQEISETSGKSTLKNQWISNKISSHSKSSNYRVSKKLVPLSTLAQSRVLNKHEKEERVRRKTLIMFIVTLVFIITTMMYFVLISVVASSEDIMQGFEKSERAVFLFFLRLYFINHVINPFIYGSLDPEFRRVLRGLCNK